MPSSHVTLAAQPRTAVRKRLSALRRSGQLPAHVYGHGASSAIQIDAKVFARMHELRQTSGLIDLTIAGQPREVVLVHHLDYAPGSHALQHVDFFRINMREMMNARVPLHFTGESAAAKASNGVVIPLIEAIDIACLPGDLPEAVTVDVAKLTTLDVVLHASDIDLPAGVTLRINPTEPVAKVQAQRGGGEQPATVAAAATPAAEA